MNTKTISHISNLFTTTQIQSIYSALSTYDEDRQKNVYPFTELGRLHVENLELPEDIYQRIRDVLHLPQHIVPIMPPLYVEYSPAYGEPNLRPHFDRDTNCLIVDYQLEANAVWPLGADLTLYPLKDNEALAFNPNETIHWRTIKTFQPGEYVKMLFFRFYDELNPTPDYSHLPDNANNEVFAAVNALRDSLI